MVTDSPAREVLENGLVVVASRRPDAPLVATTLLYRVGSLHETAGKTGLAHLMEHMMFRGTSSHPQGEIDAATGRLGGINNALTTTDYTAFYFVLPAEHWRVPLEIEADRMEHCTIEPDSFATEKRVALEERKMFDDEPETKLEEAIDELALTVHPYRYPVVGRREDLARLTLADLRAFYSDHYGPDNAILVVAGDIDQDRVLAEAGRLFGGLAPASPPQARTTVEPPQTSPRHVTVRNGSGTPQSVLAYRIPSATHRDSATLEVLASILAAGRGSRLYRRFVDGERTANEISATHMLQCEPGLFYLSATLHPGPDPGAFDAAVLEILRDLASASMPEAELERAKNQIRIDWALGRETCLGLAGALAFWETLGCWELEEAHDRSVLETTGEDLATVVGRYFDPEKRSSAWLVS